MGRLLSYLLLILFLVPFSSTPHGEVEEFLPRPGKIAFVSERDGNKEIYVIDPDGKNLTRLTHNNVPDDKPEWSPDGRKILFCSSEFDIDVMDSRGKNQKRIVRNSSGQVPAIIEWSPNGREIVFETDAIYVVDVEGINQVKLTDGHNPTWLPDGKRLAYKREGGLYTIDVNTKEKKGPFNQISVCCFQRASPRENKLLFETHSQGAGDLIVLDVDKRTETNVTNGNGHNSTGIWSPDGRKIAFIPSGDLWVVDRDGKNSTRLTQNQSVSYPLWSPDSRRILVSIESKLHIIDLKTKSQIQLTPDAASSPTWQRKR